MSFARDIQSDVCVRDLPKIASSLVVVVVPKTRVREADTVEFGWERHLFTFDERGRGELLFVLRESRQSRKFVTVSASLTSATSARDKFEASVWPIMILSSVPVANLSTKIFSIIDDALVRRRISTATLII